METTRARTKYERTPANRRLLLLLLLLLLPLLLLLLLWFRECFPISGPGKNKKK